jgi:hypothetical protein
MVSVVMLPVEQFPAMKHCETMPDPQPVSDVETLRSARAQRETEIVRVTLRTSEWRVEGR